MANNPFDRTTFGLRERPMSSDFNRGFSQADRTLRDLLALMFSARSLTSAAGVPYTGFIADSFRCVPTSPLGMSVQLQAGLGFYYTTEDVPFDIGISDLEAVDDRSRYKPMFLIAPQTFTVPAAPSAGNSRIDIIEVKYNRQLTEGDVRRQLDVSTLKFMDHLFFKTLSFQLDTQTGMVFDPFPSSAPMGYKIGVVAPTGSEIEPSASPGYIKVARINVGPTVTTINSDAIVDRRCLIDHSGNVRGSVRWRQRWNSGSPLITIQSVLAPPGVDVAFIANTASGLKQNGALFIIAGAPVQGTAIATPAPNTPNGTTSITGNAHEPLILTLDAISQASFTAAGFSVGVGQTLFDVQTTAYYQNDPAPIGSQLDDIVWTADFTLAYR